MKFIFLLIMGFFHNSFESRIFELAGFVERTHSGYIYSLSVRDNGKAVYVNTDDFNTNEIEFEIMVRYGDLTENCMYYGSNDTELTVNTFVTLSSCEPSYKTSIDKYDSNFLYYYFKIPKLKGKYLCVSFPLFKLTSYKGDVSIQAFNYTSLVSIILIIVGVVIFVTILIIVIIYFIKKKRNKSKISLLPEEEENYPVAPPIQPYSTSLPDNTPIFSKNESPIEPDYPPPPS